jgi:exodeoxyribonuclease V alpha subunit
MARHLTVRMAWHDNNWNGRICTKPEENIYCVGNHSLLSERIARDKKVNIEKKYSNAFISKVPGYLPPCYWSTNAFSSLDNDIGHRHPFLGRKADPIPDKLPAYSMFTWPFRLSFNHSEKKKRIEGEYPPDLEDRISHFIKKFTANESFVFFYLNYDNPISSEEGYYVLVGCALLSNIALPKRYNIDPASLAELKQKNSPKYKNFPEINWALPITYHFKQSGILLPYKAYWERAKEHEEEKEKLDRMRVLIEEDTLIPSFKYVANDIDDDKCIYLLYKLRKAIMIIKEDHIVNMSEEEKRVDEFLAKAWAKRGLYPSLGTILDVVAEFDGKSAGKGSEIAIAIKENLKEGEDLLISTFDIMLSSSRIPDYLKPLSRWVDAIRKNLRDYDDQIELLKKLCLFSLTRRQIERILREREEAFRKHISAEEIASNPYLIAEEYIPQVSPDDLDLEEMPDGPIGLFTIDIGMHPDPNYAEGNPAIQNLSPAGKERIRAIVIDFLYQRGKAGDCYANLDDVYEYIRDYPLFYKSVLNISKEKLEEMKGDFKDHFEERIRKEKNKTGTYFYLNEVKEAERIVKKTVTTLLERADYDFEIQGLQEFVEEEANKIAVGVQEFDKGLFTTERYTLLSTVLKKHFYIISGRPGSGKTKVIGKIVKELIDKGEGVVLLAPTGKATLRLQEEVKDYGVETQTIDRFIYSTEFRKCLELFENLVLLKDEQRLQVQNLIIDECSMVDLQRLAVLFKMLWKRDSEDAEELSVKRVILVGDENQLPPIGFGRPFFDIIEWMKLDARYRNGNYVQLRSNCRQGFDPTILRIAEIYESKNRYFEETLERLRKGGVISKGFQVELWENHEELKKAITKHLDKLLPNGTSTTAFTTQERSEGLNLLFGLYKGGYVKDFNPQTMDLENLQVLSPYRGELYGTLGLNNHLKATYRGNSTASRNYLRQFDHADKIIRINNWYGYDRDFKARKLRLSNGSIGLVCDGREGRRFYYFHDQKRPLEWIDDEDNFELAYAITVHKAQGSEFKHVFLVVPKRQALLTKELLYTGLTRSTETLVLFLQESDKKSPLQLARERSAILSRNTSIFTEPEDIRGKLWPDKNVPVKSKIEYILYKYLDQAQREKRLRFEYEDDLLFENKGLTVHPDFTIWIGNRKYFWEHLGELDVKRYSRDWAERRKDYEANGLIDSLITTDDLEGLREELVHQVIDDIVKGQLRNTPESRFSKHHYQLYL